MPEWSTSPSEAFQTAKTYKFFRRSFFEAGLADTNLPPAQDPDAFDVFENVLPIVDGVIKKRWGYALFHNPATTIRRMYEYQKDATLERRIILTSSSAVRSINEDGTSHNSAIFTPTLGAVHPRVLVSRSFAYFADNIAGDLKKWDGSTSGGVTKWGIVSPTGGTASATASPTTVVSDAGSGGTVAWSNPLNAVSSNDAYADCALATGQLGHYLKATGFGFAVPSTAAITGIEVLIEKLQTTTTTVRDHTVKLVKAGAVVGSNAALSGEWPATDTIFTYGSPTSKWGEEWTPADINSATFGVVIAAHIPANPPPDPPPGGGGGGGGSGDDPTFLTAHIDHVQIKVYYTTDILLGNKTAGNVTLAIGRKYQYVFKNSTTGHVSDLSPLSASTGPLSNQQQDLSNLLASSDPQVDKKILLATADGGDPSTLFFLAELPNATTTYTDNTPEATLLLRSVYLETDEFGTERGVAGNLPPPNANLPTKHRGRVWMAASQHLFFSKNRAELTTSSGLIAGRYEECWPAEYSMDISEGAETVRALLSDGSTLYVGTERSVRRILGDSPENFSKPEVLFNNVGVLNQDVLKLVSVEGQPIGAIWITPDLRIIFSDFNTYKSIGTPIYGTLRTINTAAMHKSVATFFADKENDWYLLAVPTGSNTEPDTVLLYNLRNQRWHVWKPTDTVTSFLHNIDVEGIPQLLFGAGSGVVYKFRSTDTQDRVNNTPVSFTTTVRTSWLDLGDPHIRKAINWVEINGVDSALSLTAQGASTDTTFTSPNSVASAVAPTAGPFGDLRYFIAPSTAKDRFYRFQFVSSASTTSPILRMLTINVSPVHSQ